MLSSYTGVKLWKAHTSNIKVINDSSGLLYVWYNMADISYFHPDLEEDLYMSKFYGFINNT